MMLRSRYALVLLVLGLTACGGSDGGGAGGRGGAGGSSAGSSAGGSSGGSAGSGGSATAGSGGSSSAGSGGATAGTGGGAAGTGGSSSAGAGGSSSAGTGGSAVGGSGGGGTGGSGGSGGSGGTGGTGGTARGGSGGTASGGRGGGGGTPIAMMAMATIAPTGTNTVTGTATFNLNPQGLVSLQITLANCPPGPHSAHLHELPSCGSNGNDAGAHWVPKGEIIMTFTCAANGTGSSTTIATTPSYWTIGGDASSNVLSHAIMIHEAADPSAGARIGCGVAAVTP